MRIPKTLLACLLPLAFVPIICAVAFAYMFYWQPDPVSPPPTQPGVDAAFDYQLEEFAGQWSLLFRQNDRIVSTEGHGHNPTVLVDLHDVAAADPYHLSHETISTTGVRLALSSYTYRDPDQGGPILDVVLVDLRDGRHSLLPLPPGDFEPEPSDGLFWLTNDLLVVKTHRYTGADAFSEQLRFLLFDAEDASLIGSFEFPPCPMFAGPSQPSASLLVASDCTPLAQREVWAIDNAGQRRATPAEVALFNELELDRYPPLSKYQHPYAAFPLITIEPIWGGPDGFGSFYERNWNRDYMYLGEDLVRVSDVFITFDEDWQSGLELFLWTEADQTFIMDSEGHYRHLFDGVYLGRTPKGP